MRNEGHLVVYCTTRNQAEAYSVIHHFRLPYDYLILNNGSLIENMAGQKLYHRTIPSENGMEILKSFSNYPGFSTYFCLDNGQNFEIENDFQIPIQKNGYASKKAFWEAAETADAYDMVGIKQSKTNARFSEFVRIASDIKQYYGAHISVSLNSLHSLIITAGNQTKASAMMALLSLLDKNMEVFCIGDSCNDICMFPHSEQSFAFFRSSRLTKSSADMLVPNVHEAIRQIMCFPISAEKRKRGMR